MKEKLIDEFRVFTGTKLLYPYLDAISLDDLYESNKKQELVVQANYF
jgi:hypothetical protein